MCELRIEHRDRVALLMIDRPKRRNAIGADLVARLSAHLARLDRDKGTSVVVLAGSGAGFCAGSDLKELAGTDLAGMQEHEAQTAALCRSIALLDKPVIAAVHGFALGGGFVLAISCDIVVSAPDARWHLPEVTIGWIPPWGLQAVVARVGPVEARRLTWGAQPIDGLEAHRLGLIDYLSPSDKTSLEAALDHAQQLAALPAAAVRSTKQFFAPIVNGGAEAADAWANRLFAADCGHEAAQTTLRKFGVRE